MEWNKENLSNFFRQHPFEIITVEEPGGTLRIQGKIQEVVELNLCSHLLLETSLSTQIPNFEISLTFHNDFLGIHCLGKSTGVSDPIFSFPAQIPYSNISVKLE